MKAGRKARRAKPHTTRISATKHTSGLSVETNGHSVIKDGFGESSILPASETGVDIKRSGVGGASGAESSTAEKSSSTFGGFFKGVDSSSGDDSKSNPSTSHSSATNKVTPRMVKKRRRSSSTNKILPSTTFSPKDGRRGDHDDGNDADGYVQKVEGGTGS